MKKVSFDFDGTLSRKDVQDYAKSLIKKDIEVWVTTSRYFNEDDYEFTKMDNNDLYKVIDYIGIPKERVTFTNRKDKALVMEKDFIWHLDDDWLDLKLINSSTNIVGISVFGSSSWKYKCDKLLKHD